MLFAHKFTLPVAVSRGVGIVKYNLFSEPLCLGIATFHLIWLAQLILEMIQQPFYMNGLKFIRSWNVFIFQVSLAATETDDSRYDEKIDVDEDREQ